MTVSLFFHGPWSEFGATEAGGFGAYRVQIFGQTLLYIYRYSQFTYPSVWCISSHALEVSLGISALPS